MAVFISMCAWGLYLYAGGVLEVLCAEDSWLETLTALFYFFGGLSFIYLIKSCRFKPIGCIGLALLYFVVAGEEVSWGQRIFGFESPEAMEEFNVQQEMSLHNLIWLQDYYRMLGLGVVLGLTLVLPLAVRFVGWIRRWIIVLGVPLCPLRLNVVVVLGIAFMFVPRLIGINNMDLFELDEVGEFLLALALMGYAVCPDSVESIELK